MRGIGVVVLASCLVGCSDAPPDPATGGSGAGAGTGAAAGNTGGGGSSAGGTGGTGGYACNPPDFPREDVTESVDTVSGNVRDLTGAPVVMVLSDVCGTNVCLAGETDANGDFSVSGSPTDLADARFVYGDGLTHAKMAGRVTGLPSTDVGTFHTPELPLFADGATIVAGEDATQNGVTLHVPAGAQIDHDIILYEEGERGWRTVMFTPSDGTFPAPASLNMEVLIAVAPVHSLICPAAGLTFPNTANWAAGAAVEILFNNVEIFDSFAPYGDWAVVAEATVSSDGTTVTTNDGEGIVELGTLGARLEQ